jgi:selenocysteine-specific translation elongation factor
MPNLNVAIIGSPDYAKNLGKKSTTSDITFFDQKKGEATVTFVEPTMYPDRLAPLFYSVSMADIAVVVVDQVTPTLGESILMLDSVGVGRGYIVLRNYLTKDQLLPFLKGTLLEHYEFIEDDPVKIREMLLAEAETMGDEPDVKTASSGSVPIDHHFDVKGVGTVILGWVAEGFVRKHDDVRLLPGGKPVQIRSIQKHDDDFNWAVKGDRVGIALKGITIDDLDRGMILSNNKSIKTASALTGKAHIIKYWLNPLTPGMVLHVGHWMQFVPARVDTVKSEGDWRTPSLTLALQKELVYIPGSRAVITYLEGGKLRVIGTVELV